MKMDLLAAAMRGAPPMRKLKALSQSLRVSSEAGLEIHPLSWTLGTMFACLTLHLPLGRWGGKGSTNRRLSMLKLLTSVFPKCVSG